jgi:hypothetical protein
MQNEIDKLIPTKIQNMTVEHQLLFTMIDGKICSTLSDISSAVCYICGAKPSEMNDVIIRCRQIYFLVLFVR